MTTERNDILYKKPRKITNEFLLAYSREYNSLKDQGLFPTEIRDVMVEKLNYSFTTHYDYLRKSRNKGFITDSFEENMAIANEIKRQWFLSLGGRITGEKFSLKDFIKRLLSGSKDKSPEEDEIGTDPDTSNPKVKRINILCRLVKKLLKR